jgi:hypothetical protein
MSFVRLLEGFLRQRWIPCGRRRWQRSSGWAKGLKRRGIVRPTGYGLQFNESMFAPYSKWTHTYRPTCLNFLFLKNTHLFNPTLQVHGFYYVNLHRLVYSARHARVANHVVASYDVLWLYCIENGPLAIWLNRFWCLMINITCGVMCLLVFVFRV